MWLFYEDWPSSQKLSFTTEASEASETSENSKTVKLHWNSLVPHNPVNTISLRSLHFLNPKYLLLPNGPTAGILGPDLVLFKIIHINFHYLFVASPIFLLPTTLHHIIILIIFPNPIHPYPHPSLSSLTSEPRSPGPRCSDCPHYGPRKHLDRHHFQFVTLP